MAEDRPGGVDMTFQRLVLLTRVALALLLALAVSPSPAAAGPPPRPEDAPEVQAARRSLEDDPDDRGRYLEVIRVCLALGSIEGRREADLVFRKALRKWPRDTELLLAWADLKEERRFRGQARRLFQRALKEEPDLVPARLGLARLSLFEYRRHLDRKELRRCAEELDRVLDVDAGHAEALALSAFVRWTLQDSLAAGERARALTDRHPDDPRGHFFLMALAAESGRWEEAGDHADRALLGLTAPGDLEAYDTLGRLDFRIEDRRQDGSDGQRRRIETEFWRRRDPTPATDLNERRVEHLRRVFLADQLYGLPETGLRGWNTDAGEAIVRFGVPEERWLGLGAQVLYMFRPNRMYQRHRLGDDDLTLYFDDPFLSGHWVEPYDWGLPSTMDKLAAVIEATMDHPIGGPAIDIALDAVRFRDPDGRTRLDVVVAVSDPPDTAGGWLRPMAAYDSEWRTLDRVSGTLATAARVENRETPGKWWLVDLVSLRLPADAETVQVGTQVEVGRRRGFGSRIDRFILDPLPRDSVALSDILLLDRMAFGNAERLPLARGGGFAVPHPTGIYLAGESVPIYFEMYGLSLDDDGASRCDITVEVLDLKRTSDWVAKRGQALIDRRERPKSHARVTFEEHGTTSSAERLLDVSVGTLPRGDYALRVRIDDRVSGRHAESETAFRVARPPKEAPVPAPVP